MDIVSFGLTDIGKKRSSNQDAIYLNSKDHFYLLADGAGGYNGGDIASAMALELIPEYFLGQSLDEGNVKHHLKESIKYANQSILDEVEKRPELEGMGTTVVGIYFYKDTLYIVNVGDSRLYLIQGGGIFQLTRDHSLVQEKIDLGIYTREEAARDPMQNILVRIVGREDVSLADVFSFKALPHHCFLLCSDGLHGELDDESILALVSPHLTGDEKCTEAGLKKAGEVLVDRANQKGGRDNISVILSAVT